MKVRKTLRKQKQRGGTRETSVASETINGYSISMGSHDGYKSPSEDRHSVLPIGDMSLLVSVFDGHSGSQTADYINKNLPVNIKRRIEKDAMYRDTEAIKKIMEEEFEAIDAEIRRKLPDSGSTGSVVFINPESIVVANVGDSPVLYFTKEGELLFHSEDHDCSNQSEVKRLEEAGGKCMMRTDGVMGVDGALMVTRAFGDFMFKPAVSAKPQTYSFQRRPSTFLVVCSDSFTERIVPERQQIINVATPEEIVREILPKLKQQNFELGVHAAIEAQVKRDGFYEPRQPNHRQYYGDNTTLVAVKFPSEQVKFPSEQTGGTHAKTLPTKKQRKVRKEKTRNNK